MQYSREIEREISENGVEIDLGSVYARLSQLRECLKSWANEVHYMRGIIWETLLMKLLAIEAKNK